MISIEVAGKLLDFGRRIGDGQRAREQLEGAVAIHNILQSRGIAYLADEVGMGKTYVALGALALFRHVRPDFRVLILAPRENIQRKWMKEMRNFVAHNVRFADLRVKALDGTPVRPLVFCGNVPDLLAETSLDPNRDFFARMTSFSVPVAGKDQVRAEDVRKLRDELQRHLPWLDPSIFDLRTRRDVKDNFARAVCCGLPTFDLVIVDEAHNLKAGFREYVAARNRVLALAFGHSVDKVSTRAFPNFHPRAAKVLFLSATPIEETYEQLWNQLDIFGKGHGFEALKNREVDEEEKKQLAGQFLVRRVTQIEVNGKKLTKNLYRREWRGGGVHDHDEPIRVTDPRQRLVVALVQKKVSEVLGQTEFNNSFQIGMLASFESFLVTAKVATGNEEVATFDDADQTDISIERDGLDVSQVNHLARSYRAQFGTELPHPKMDAVVASLKRSWRTGQKALIFVRRVASVRELKRRLDDQYDEWLMERLRLELPHAVRPRLDRLFDDYRQAKEKSGRGTYDGVITGKPDRGGEDRGGTDTFFAWFFRGDGPPGVVSGANLQQRFTTTSSAYSVFFARNHLAELLEVRPGKVVEQLAVELGVTSGGLRDGLRERARRFLSQAARVTRGDRYEAAQAAAIEWLKEKEGRYQEAASHLWHERFQSSLHAKHAGAAPDLADDLETPTFFTELGERPALRDAIWPAPKTESLRGDVREAEQRAQLLTTAARLGHAFIDLYILLIQRLGSLDARTQEVAASEDTGDLTGDTGRIHEYLDLLEAQARTEPGQRDWGAFDELSDLSQNFPLILDVNAPEARERPLSETARMFGALLRQQQPIGGMYGQVNQTLVRQFRMPGYPFVLCTTDLLQEGEDLHTFCSAVQHYGISWTPSSMEQRIGRIDRVRSATDRRLAGLERSFQGADKLQVYYPYLDDTIEILQVRRVLERINTFLRLMHEGLAPAAPEEKRLHVGREILGKGHIPDAIQSVLESAFPIRAEYLLGTRRALAVEPQHEKSLRSRFQALRDMQVAGLEIEWEDGAGAGVLEGVARLGDRRQPFRLTLGSIGQHTCVHAMSFVGKSSCDDLKEGLSAHCLLENIRLGVVDQLQEGEVALFVFEDLLLREERMDAGRVGRLIADLTRKADSLEQWLFPGSDATADQSRAHINAAGENSDG